MEHRRYYLLLGFREQLLEGVPGATPLLECASEGTPWIREQCFQEPPRVDWIILNKEIPEIRMTYAMLALDCGVPVSLETAIELVQSMEAVYAIWSFCSHVPMRLSPLPLPDDIRSISVPLSEQWLLEHCADEIYSCYGGAPAFQIAFGTYCVLPPNSFRRCFPWVRRCLRDERFRSAVLYLYQSMKELGWDHCDWRRERYDDHFNPHISISEAESAVVNAFKSIEAIVGEPNRNPHKLAMRLRDNGLDPDARLGILNNDTLFNLVVNFHRIRDSVAAHGSITNRKRRLTVPEIIEMQAVARYILLNSQSRTQ